MSLQQSIIPFTIPSYPQMESQQDIVDLTINDDDDCLFPTELSEMVNSLLKMDGMRAIKKLLSKSMKMTL